jgi:hypothetical protein
MKLKATYKTEVITKNTLVKTEQANSISFENIGLDDATINTDIPLRFDGLVREFLNNDPEITIPLDFTIIFANKTENKQVLIIKRFYE